MFQLFSFIKYFLIARSRTETGINDPFVNDLLACSPGNGRNISNPAAEDIRDQACRSGEVIEVTDYGAGTRKHLSMLRPVSRIMRQTAMDKKSGQILSALAAYVQPKMIIELGTGLGISTMYLAGVNPDAQIITIEGCREIARIASRHFQTAGYKNIKLLEGRFREVLPAVLSVTDHPLMVIIDGDHREISLLDNISLFKPVIKDDSIMVIDDIHLSPDMNRAWQKLIAMPDVRLSIDLFRLGLLFFRKGISKQHHILRV